MNKMLLIVIAACLSCACKGQSIAIKRKGNLVILPKYFSAKGVIIQQMPEFLKFKIDFDKSFSPTDSDLIKTEQIVVDNFADVSNKLNGNQTFDKVQDRDLYKNWYRQYFAYMDKQNKKMVYVRLVKCCKKIKKCFPDWQKEIVIMLTEGDCIKSAGYLVDLQTNRIVVL